MSLVSEADFQKQAQSKSQFINAIKGHGEFDRVLPDCVKILVNECNTLGETLMRHTLHRFGHNDGVNGHMITISELESVVTMFHYRLSEVDLVELRSWVFNAGLLVTTPKYFREDLIFLDTEKLLRNLKEEYIKMGFTSAQLPESRGTTTMTSIFEETRDHILHKKAAELCAKLQMF